MIKETPKVWWKHLKLILGDVEYRLSWLAKSGSCSRSCQIGKQKIFWFFFVRNFFSLVESWLYHLFFPEPQYSQNWNRSLSLHIPNPYMRTAGKNRIQVSKFTLSSGRVSFNLNLFFLLISLRSFQNLTDFTAIYIW